MPCLREREPITRRHTDLWLARRTINRRSARRNLLRIHLPAGSNPRLEETIIVFAAGAYPKHRPVWAPDTTTTHPF